MNPDLSEGRPFGASRPYLTDFGIAKLAEADGGLTRTGCGRAVCSTWLVAWCSSPP